MRILRVLLPAIFLSLPLFVSCQQGYLFIKKGAKKALALGPGDELHVKLRNGSYAKGRITGFGNDTIRLNGYPVAASQVSEVLLKQRPKNAFPNMKTMLLITGGAGLTVAGLTLSDQQDFQQAAVTAAVIAYGPLLVRHFGLRLLRSMHRKKYRIGKKFRLQVLDLSR